ncbi:Ig-like domain-containing protein [Epilithonimonas xixisoli]|uniref:Putative secreted protein (Por secretion system target) n=1 Tax=Epilithonimonas xixisoli TaxID=1476462 RepID=A0A4R8IBG3_9FLAO|nr:Ig-like domain-containing protein [Epilithonimonas xixisoli]TDX87024.1 putative secreted protein (Por secretion system target) [Epilithonimonas xixisoli]
MIKNYFLLFLLLFSNLFFAQTDLVRWNKGTNVPTVSGSHLTAGNLSATVNLSNYDYWIGGTKYNVFATGGWPTPQQAIDYSKYLQFTIRPDNLYKLNVTEFNFRCIMQGGSAKMRIDYSLDANFSNPKEVLAETTITSTMTTFALTNFPKPIATDGQVLHLRMYIYNTNNAMQLLFKEGDNHGPVFKGTVESSSTTPVAYNDTYSNFINDDLDLNVLSNDDFSNTVDSIRITQPLHGTTKINPNNTVNYLPDEGYAGSDTFTYYIKNKFGKSNTATVTVNTTINTSTTLIRWDKNDFQGTSLQPSFISSTQMTNGGGVTVANGSENTPVFIFSNLSSSATLDSSKYTEFVLYNNSSIKTIEPKSFNFTGRGYIGGSANYEVRYSKNSNFSSNVFTLSSGTFNASFEDKKFNFNSDVKVEPGERLYIRLYFYRVNGQYAIRYLNNSLGPAIEGIFYNHVYSSNGTMWHMATPTSPNWSNGLPNATRNAIIQTKYDTSINGNFESQNLTINEGGTLNINAGGYITVNGQIVNRNSAETSFVLDNDANLLQNTAAPNVGKITVKKLAVMPKMGYNYWSSPVDGQNLYQFSAGYNQAVAANYNPNGTPWNRFYVYDEKTDYFKTSIPGEITLNSESTFEKARGYAIRGKNNFDVNITNTTPVANFEFVGTPRNGDISSYPLKWTDANHGFNMIGNPYPSNIDFEDFYDLNKTKINAIAYFWTNNDGKFVGQQSSNYGGNNYATINNGGGVSATYVGNASKRPTGSISVGQGFIIQAIETGKNQPLTFNNSLRTTSVANYYNKTTVQKNRFWLEFKSPTDINNEILIAYINNATNNFDKDYDADLLAVGSDSFWSVLDNRKLAIQSKNPNFNQDDVVRVGFKASVSGNYTISLTDREGIFDSNQSVYLKDQNLDKIVDITATPYVFFTNSGQYENRFEIVYKSSGTLGTGETNSKGIIVTKNSQNFIVKSPENLDEVSVYDALGRLIYNSKISTKEVLINNANFAEGLYIIKARSGSTIVTKKVLK